MASSNLFKLLILVVKNKITKGRVWHGMWISVTSEVIRKYVLIKWFVSIIYWRHALISSSHHNSIWHYLRWAGGSNSSHNQFVENNLKSGWTLEMSVSSKCEATFDKYGKFHHHIAKARPLKSCWQWMTFIPTTYDL